MFVNLPITRQQICLSEASVPLYIEYNPVNRCPASSYVQVRLDLAVAWEVWRSEGVARESSGKKTPNPRLRPLGRGFEPVSMSIDELAQSWITLDHRDSFTSC